MEPDLIIVVGGTEFHEFSQDVCRWSGYCRGALAHGMAEVETKKLTFESGNPEEWEWVRAFMAPRSTEKITAENVDVALVWFSDLNAAQGLAECDDFVVASLNSKLGFDGSGFGSFGPQNRLVLGDALDALEKSVQYGLPKSKVKAMNEAKFLLKTIRSLGNSEGVAEVERIISLVERDADCRETLWSSPTALKDLVTPSLPNEINEEQLLGNELRSTIVYLALGVSRSYPIVVSEIPQHSVSTSAFGGQRDVGGFQFGGFGSFGGSGGN